MLHTFTVLHLSDLHARSPREAESWRRRRVVGAEVWRRNLDELQQDGPIDLVCFTGDLAQAGLLDEYDDAAEFLHFTLQQLSLPPERLAIVPGNHDIDRSQETTAWQMVRRNVHRFDDLEISGWLAGGAAPFGFTDDLRDKLLTRQGKFRSWLAGFGLEHLAAERSPHGKLGFRHTLQPSDRPFAVHLIGLDSAWLCGDDSDSGRLRLTEDQVMRLTTDHAGRPLPGLRLALVHHPLSDLADGTPCRRLLAEHVDVLLRGHLHEAEPELWADPERTLRQFAAGSLDDPQRAYSYRNNCSIIRAVCDDKGHPQRYELRFRSFSPRGYWVDDGSLYHVAATGRLTVEVTKQRNPLPGAAAAEPKRPQLRIFVGRQGELRRLASALLPAIEAEPPRPVVPVILVGLGGVGKSTLAEQFFHQHSDQFPGGLIRLDLPLDTHVPPDAEGLRRQMADQIGMQPSRLSLQEALLIRLRQPRSLLLIENVDSYPAGEAVAALVSGFPECAVLITGRLFGLGTSVGWAQVEVSPFAEAEALALLSAGFRRADDPRDAEEQKALVRELQYHPLAIQLAAGHLRSGRTVAGLLHLLQSKGFALQPADPGATIWRSSQLSLDLLREQLGGDAERLLHGLAAFAWVPAVFVGIDLGAAVADLSAAEFERLMVNAHLLSIVQRSEDGIRWRLHPLMGYVARSADRRLQAQGRLSQWFLSRLPQLPPDRAAEQGQNWRAIHAERDALTEWMAGLTGADARAVVKAGEVYARLAGSFLAWAGLCERGLAQQEQEPGEHALLLWVLCIVLERGGQPQQAEKKAHELREFAKKTGNERFVAFASGQIADILESRGQLEEALRIRREEELPVYKKLGDTRSQALTMGLIAGILAERGKFDEALRIRLEEELPVYVELGDIRSRAVTVGHIADIYKHRGQLDEALDMLRKESIPVFEKLGDIHSRAVAMGKIADIYQDRGQLDEALCIRREEELPVYDKLGAIHARAVSMGKIAQILQARGDLDEALRILDKESRPAFEKLGDIGARAGTMGQIADILRARGQLQEALRIHRKEQLPVYEELGDIRSRAKTMGQIADILRDRGQQEEALRICREEELPVYEKLGDIRSRAVTMGQIADVMQDREMWNEALRIRQGEQLPLFEQLGDIRSKAVTMSKIAGILQRQGKREDPAKLDAALRIVLEQSLPVYEKLGDIRLAAVARTQVAGIRKAKRQFDEAVELLDSEVLPALEPLRILLPLTRARYVLAQVLLLRGKPGDRERARQQLELAYAAAAPPGFALAERVRALQLRHGFLRLEIWPLQTMVIENVRSITRLELPLHPRLTVLFGRNGCGKTTVLDALALGLSALGRLLYKPSNFHGFGHALLRREWPGADANPRVVPYCRTTLMGAALRWDETVLRDDTEASRTAAASGVGIGALARRLEATLKAIGESQGEWDALPIFAYYGAQRAVEAQTQQEANLLSELPRLDATAGALEATIRFQHAVDWFRTIEDRERREREKRGDVQYRSPALDAVRGVIERVLPDCHRPRISEPPERLVVDYVRPDRGVEVLDLGQLSDGYRIHLALVLDLAHRMVQANPQPPQAESDFAWGIDSHAVVLIDELDLHLHPAWQQTVLPGLLSAFPKAQFVVTTHSEQVLSSCPIDSRAWELYRDGDTIQARHPSVPLPGAASDQVLEVGMAVPSRAADHPFVRRLKEYQDLVYAGRWDEPRALSLRAELDAFRADDTGLIDADAEIDRQRLFSDTIETPGLVNVP